MYFKRLEMVGFKSFVDYTALDFEAGMTAIVGPNGCGKSNVVDALRWVLGEQSAKALRGGRMEDVIFNGTDQRKALGMAEVSLTIDNHDHKLPTEHDNVTITRRTYRSGESEYLINKVACRLRDIHDLFLDTGIGTNAYSFLEQGKIDLIVSSRPVDRRTVFEEAAGIAKYKTRKEESLRKLEATEQNLLRVNDIAVEVKRQIGTLERQAQKARRYQDLKQELTTLEVGKGRRELQERRRMLRRVEQQWEEGVVRVKELERQKESWETEARVLEADCVKAEQTAAEARAEMHKAAEEMIKCEEYISASELRKQDLKEAVARAENEIAGLVSKEEQLCQSGAGVLETLAARQSELAGLKAELVLEEERLNQLENELKDRAGQVQELQNRLLQLVDQMSSLRGNLKNLELRRQEQDKRLEHLNTLLTAVMQQRAETETEKQNLELSWQSLHADMTGLEAEKAALTQEKEGLEHTLATLQSMLDNFQQTITQLTSRLHWIEELKNGLDGYESGAKAVLLEHNAHPERFPGVVGPVANFLRTDPELELAFETLLGPKLQYILVQTRAQAQECMDFLAAENRGRATFIPCEAYDQAGSGPVGEDAQPAWQQLPNIIGRAGALARMDERFRPMLEALLDQAVIVKDLETLHQARAAGAKGTLVTLAGEVETSQGCLTGGSQDIRERGFLGRERELEELRAELEVLQRNLETSQLEARNIQVRLEEIIGGLEAKNAHFHQLQIHAAKVDKSLESVTSQQQAIEKQFALTFEEREQMTAQLDKSKADWDETSQRLAAAEAQEQQTQDDLARYQSEIDNRRQEYDRRAGRSNELRIAAATMEQQLNALAAENQRMIGELEETRGQLQGKRLAMAQDQQRIRDLETSVLERRELLARLAGDKSVWETAWASASEQRRESAERKESQMQNLRGLQQSLDAGRQTLHALELEKKQQEYQLQTLEDYLQTEYHFNLSLEEDLPAPQAEAGAETTGEPGDLETEAARIVEIKEKLAGLGTVNLVAMEEYEELKQRHEFLAKQLADLKEAEGNLQRIITKINLESRSRFHETFVQVRENFHEVFRKLFNGGEADLLLQDETNLLETGIDIIARPPGKRLQNITLLSGGEKALTAIALLFAIYLIKPSPFCIFDEMDAPLDDTNTLRFARILQEFARRSQFIAITHNKITMEKADVLYGITMQEAGVSKLVSVRFKGEVETQPVKLVEKTEIEAEVEAAALN